MDDYEIKLERSALYVVATPIGNLQDITERAKFVLQNVDWIAAEDTRNSSKLIQKISSKKKLISCHEFSSEKELKSIVARLIDGESGAFISDAGSPSISDPGAQLVQMARAAGAKIIPIPGPSAITAIISVSGFTENKHFFHGFFPRKNGDREKLLRNIKTQIGIHIFFESPHRILETLEKIAEFYPKAPLIIGRELTKKFEDIRLDTAENLLQQEVQSGNPRGEYTLALWMKEIPEIFENTNDGAESLIRDLVDLGASQKVILMVGRYLGLERKNVYRLGIDKRKK